MLKREWDKFVNRCVWSWAGWLFCWRNEPSLQFWFYINLVSASIAMVIDLNGAERAIILGFGMLILAAELMNTGIEKAVDYISAKDHPLAKAAKDTASGAVAVSAIIAAVAWIVILVG